MEIRGKAEARGFDFQLIDDWTFGIEESPEEIQNEKGIQLRIET